MRKIFPGSERQKIILWDMIGNASACSSYDSTLHDILLEEAESYFNGDKTLQETVDIIQGRAKTYIGEHL